MTNTAEVLSAAQQAFVAMGGMNWHEILNFVLAGLCILAGSVAGQHILETLIANVPLPWWLPKAMLPSILSSVVGAVMKWTGVDNATAVQSSVILAGLMHVVNETSLAADLPSKIKVIASAAASPEIAPALAALVQKVQQTHTAMAYAPGNVQATVAHKDAIAALAEAVQK